MSNFTITNNTFKAVLERVPFSTIKNEEQYEVAMKVREFLESKFPEDNFVRWDLNVTDKAITLDASDWKKYGRRNGVISRIMRKTEEGYVVSVGAKELEKLAELHGYYEKHQSARELMRKSHEEYVSVNTVVKAYYFARIKPRSSSGYSAVLPPEFRITEGRLERKGGIEIGSVDYVNSTDAETDFAEQLEAWKETVKQFDWMSAEDVKRGKVLVAKR